MTETGRDAHQQAGPLAALLDEAEQSLWGSEAADGAFSEFQHELSQHRRSDRDGWPRAIAQCRRHSLFHFFQADPLTRRAFRKPRGYAADAIMLDYVYAEKPGPVDEVGRAAFSLTSTSTLCQSLRSRRDTFASIIDEVATQRHRPRVASIAAGHLREADVSGAIRSAELRELVAFDVDDLNLAVVRRDYGRLGVRTRSGAIADLMRGRIDLGSFDFIYSAGLFDNLSDNAARGVVSALCQALRPGGRLTIANFTTGCEGDAFVEAFMDWFVTYRSVDELRRLPDGIGNRRVGEIRSWVDTCGNLAYLDLIDVDAGRPATSRVQDFS